MINSPKFWAANILGNIVFQVALAPYGLDFFHTCLASATIGFAWGIVLALFRGILE